MANFLKSIKSNKKALESDQDLVTKFRNSHDNAYIGELFQRYTHLVYGLSLKYLKNETDSQDAVMEVFEKIIVELKRHKVENFKSWLYSVTKNHCFMKLRKSKTNILHVENFDKFKLDFMESDPLTHLENGQADEAFREKLISSLNKLKDEQRKCIELFYFENQSYQEIVAITGYDIKKVKSYLQNAKRNLKLYLTGQK